MIDRRLLSFLQVYERLNYREAAESLYISQPAVTQHIQALENDLGVKLFHYENRQVERTEAADKLAIYVRAQLRNDQILRSELALQGISTLRFGATKSIGEFFIAERLVDFLSNPEQTAEITVENTSTLLEMVDANELDFALIEGHFNRSHYDHLKLREEEFVGICHAKHPFANRTVALTDLFEETVILREPGSGTRSIIEGSLQMAEYAFSDFKRQVVADNFGLICRLVARGAGISFVYRTVAEQFPDLGVFRLKGMPIHHDFNCVYLPGSNGRQLVETFLGDDIGQS